MAKTPKVVSSMRYIDRNFEWNSLFTIRATCSAQRMLFELFTLLKLADE
jgi:hypothetical protein